MAREKEDDESGRIRKEIAIDQEKYKWIRDRYGDVSLSWFFDQILTGFINVHTKSPRDYSEIAAREFGDVTAGD